MEVGTQSDDDESSEPEERVAIISQGIREITELIGSDGAVYNRLKAEVEEMSGYTVDDFEEIAEYAVHSFKEKREQARKISLQDKNIRRNIPPTKISGRVCEYDTTDSSWALKTERQLRAIVKKKGDMKIDGVVVWGTKSTMVKWLDTGNLEYEDVSQMALSELCKDRGLTLKCNELRHSMIAKLKEADDDELTRRKKKAVIAIRIKDEKGIERVLLHGDPLLRDILYNKVG